MAKTIWGMDFGDWALKVVRGSYDKKSGSITVDLFDEIVYGDLPCGFEVAPQEKHRAGIVAFRSKYEIAPGDDLCVSVSGSEVFSRFINLPPVPESIDEIIRYEARQQIPFDIDDVVWDYQPVKEEQDLEIGEEIECGLFALKKERVEELMDLLEPWRKNLRVVQNAPLAVYNLLEYEGLVGEAAVVVDIGSATTDVLVLNPPRFWVRTLLLAGDDLTRALVEQFGIGHEEAEKIKRRAGRSTHRDQILRVLQPVFDDLTNEIQRSLGYYKSIARDVRFERVLALGSALKMTGLSQMLAGALQYQVRGVQELRRVQLAGSLDSEGFKAFLPGGCAALGLVVQGAGQARVRINMVPEEVAMAGVMSDKKPWLLAAAVGLLAIVGVLVLGERLHAQDIAGAEEIVNWSGLDTARKIQQDYDAAANAANAALRKLDSMAKSDFRRDVLLHLLPVFAGVFSTDEVFVTALRVEWMEPGEITQDMPLIGGRMGARRPRARGPTMDAVTGAAAGRAAAAAAAAAGRARAGGGASRRAAASGGRGRTSGARAGTLGARPGEARVQAERTARSRLVLRFACESTEISKAFIETQVFEALRQAQLPEDYEFKPAFEKVEMLGELRDVHRDESTLEVVPEGGEGTKWYVAFEGYAVVNIGEKVAAEPEGVSGIRARRPM